jgi:uncharacterized repeat protein (TIGR03803 family)
MKKPVDLWICSIGRATSRGAIALSILLLPALIVTSPGQAQTFTLLYTFKDTPDGKRPTGDLVRDPAGNLYGVTVAGGAYLWGTIYKVDPSGNETVLYSFTGGADGATPSAGVLLDSAGNLYGTTSGGGTSGHGTVFKLDTSGNETVLYSFTGGADGSYPGGSLIRGPGGILYSTTTQGGAYGGGTVFKLDITGKETVLYSFTGGADGGYPEAGLVRDAAGNFYGTTVFGGDLTCNFGQGCGTVFKLTLAGKETVLHTFAGGTDGIWPYAGLVRDAAGNLYGTTDKGGVFSSGTLFRLDATGKETVFPFSGGANLPAGLVRDSAGNLYGTTRAGGAHRFGSIFKLDTVGKMTVLYSFTGGANDGGYPLSGLFRDFAGNLYGTTWSGNCGCRNGTVFKFAP